MEKVRKFIREMCEKTNISLRLLDDNGQEVFNNITKNDQCIVNDININNTHWKVFITQANKVFLPFIMFTLEKSISIENSIELLFEEKKDWASFESTPLNKVGKIMLIECNDIENIIEIIRDTYYGQDIYIEKFRNRIVLVGNLEDEKEHGLSLRETILQSIGKKVYISINDFDGTYSGFIESFNDTWELIDIGKVLKITPEVYVASDMNLEKAIYNLSDEYSEQLMNRYSGIFNKLSNELILTLEEVLNCNLSLSTAAKNLFIHRNTLMYRIDKIKRETGLDMRNFKEASYLYVLYINNKRRKK